LIVSGAHGRRWLWRSHSLLCHQVLPCVQSTEVMKLCASEC